MPIVSSQIIKRINKTDGSIGIYEEHTDHTERIHSYRYYPLETDDHDALLLANAARIESRLPDKEVVEEVERAKKGKQQSAQHQTQAELDKRAIVELMQIEDSLEFSTTLQWFRDFEVRAGANANARATYLGVPKPEYDLVAARYNQIQGLVDGLKADAARAWRSHTVDW